MQFKLGEYCTQVSFCSLEDAIPREAGITLFDTNTRPLFSHYRGADVVIPPGEQEKGIERVLQLVNRGFDLGLARDSLFVGCGGGVVCDMTAFAASLYMRGAKLVLVPTTLLAMVDASLGGKGGVDYRGGKNLLGAFYPATEVRIAVESLETLPNFELLNGLAEVIKHALLKDATLLSILENRREDILQRNPEVLKEVITRAIEVKGWYIQEDFRERGVRAHLNFGHTFAHPLESLGLERGATGAIGSGSAAGLDSAHVVTTNSPVTQNTTATQWSHGEAVAWGMVKALEAGVLLGVTQKDYLEMVRELLGSYGYRINHKVEDTETFLHYLQHDKKKRGGEIQFVLQEKEEKTFQQPLSRDIITAVIGGSHV